MYVDSDNYIVVFGAIYSSLPLFGQISLDDGSVISMFQGSTSYVDVVDVIAFDSYYADVFMMFSSLSSFQAFTYSTTDMDIVTTHSSDTFSYDYTSIASNTYGFLYLSASKTQTQTIFKFFFDDEGYRVDLIPDGGS